MAVSGKIRAISLDYTPFSHIRRCVSDGFLADIAPHSAGRGDRVRTLQIQSRIPMTALGLIVVCGLLAVAYGIWAITSVMSADAGSAKMQEIAAAVREGAQAYLKRQYTT